MKEAAHLMLLIDTSTTPPTVSAHILSTDNPAFVVGDQRQWLRLGWAAYGETFDQAQKTLIQALVDLGPRHKLKAGR